MSVEAYVLSVDQSTQGTKALLFDRGGAMLARADAPHRQIIGSQGYISHDAEEIYQNVLKTAGMVIRKAGVDAGAIACMGISNQRETVVAWDADTGAPVCDAVVWQCARASQVCARVTATGIGELVRRRTGIPISPYFPASKLAWILQNVPAAANLAQKGRLRAGTMDAWLLWKLTGQHCTDASNASRTQLLNIDRMQWDADICRAFGVREDMLPRVEPSDAAFGQTTLGGLLPRPIPVRGVMGDSHAALFGQGCVDAGMTKVTYGTGASIMMNVGPRPMLSQSGLVTSVAWQREGRVWYVMEGNLNYAGAVVTWLKDSLGLIASAEETGALAEHANPSDTTYLVPAFTGLGAPYWRDDARAVLCGMSRVTGRAELARAALDGIAYQVYDVLRAMEKDASLPVATLYADGGVCRSRYLMQFQASILDRALAVSRREEMSAVGSAYMAGLAAGVMDDSVFAQAARTRYDPRMTQSMRSEKLAGWHDAVARALMTNGGKHNEQ